jgi:hypothetical protein
MIKQKVLNKIVVYAFLIFIFSCELPPEPDTKHKLSASAVFQSDRLLQSVYVDTTYNLDAILQYAQGIFPMSGISNAAVELHTSDTIYHFVEDTLLYGCHGDYICSIEFIPCGKYILKISYDNFEPLIVDFIFPDSVSLIYPNDLDTIQVGSRIAISWSSGIESSCVEKYFLSLFPSPIGINALDLWINRSNSTYTVQKFGMSNDGNNIVYGYSNNWITIKINSISLYNSEDIINGYGYFRLEYSDSVKIFSSIDSIQATWN